MQKEMIDKANEIVSLIEKNERAIKELSKYVDSGKIFYTEKYYPFSYDGIFHKLYILKIGK